MLNLKGKAVLIVGGGNIAARKIRTLQATGAVITVISPTLSAQIDLQQINWVARAYHPSDLNHANLIFACTDDPTINTAISQAVHAGQWVNNTGDKTQSDFYNMAVAKSGQVTVAISTGGRAPKLAKRIRQLLLLWLIAQPWQRERSERD
ncbi:precorrin-2 dehydrogenase/sirohydrochlorin ferrochelatase family protein [Loigolactobacillus binensis]|uniref:precorrin-2 dehydrogenase n=2 Tax=Loigolactobacillus binensis TaxID=2559922 RepID=A0ABW3E9W6_9LACO